MPIGIRLPGYRFFIIYKERMMIMKKLFLRILASALCIICFTGSISAAQVPLALGNHARWFDRIDKPQPDYATEFYTWLEANAGSDGLLAKPTRAEYIGGNYYAFRAAHYAGSRISTVTTRIHSMI